MKSSNDYIIAILERVRSMEVMLRDYEELEENTEEAKAIASRAREGVEEIRRKLESDEIAKKNYSRWSKRTVLAALLSATLALLFNIVFTIIKIKFGW
jgi:hypothetical protein